MKRILSLLLAFVFLQVETWALSGGPNYGGNTSSLIGTYAGVFTGISGSGAGILGNISELTGDVGSNALGVFVVGVPQTDVAQGTIALFFQGTFFQGGILGMADPNKKTLVGVAQTVHIREYSTTTDLLNGRASTSLTYDARCDGTLKTKIEGGLTFGTTIKGSGVFTTTVIIETPISVPNPEDPANPTVAVLETPVPTGTLSFKVDGYKQSQQVVFPNLGSTAALLNGAGASVPNQGQ